MEKKREKKQKKNYSQKEEETQINNREKNAKYLKWMFDCMSCLNKDRTMNRLRNSNSLILVAMIQLHKKQEMCKLKIRKKQS